MSIIIASEGHGAWCEHFLRHVLRDKHVIFENSNRSQLVVRSCFLTQEREFPKNLPYITWSGEPLGVINRNYPPLFKIWEPKNKTLLIETSNSPYNKDIYTGYISGDLQGTIANIGQKNADKIFYIPFLVVIYFDYQATFNLKLDLTDLRLPQYRNNARPNFLAYCASAPIPIRESLFSLLKGKEGAHGLGKCQTTPGRKVEGTFHDMRNVYSTYRFAFAMENSTQHHYVTEKLFNVLLSGAIPIYYGDDEWVKKVFNEKCIIFVQDFPTLQDCANRIIEIDNDPVLLQKYLDEPRFVKDKSWFTNHPDYDKMREIILNSF